MSDYETHSGKIKKLIPFENESFEDQCKRLWILNGELEDEYDEGFLFEKFYKKYLNIKDKEIWEIFDHVDYGDDDMYCRLFKNNDDSYSFDTRFYNGGTCITEMLEDELKKL